MAAAWTFDPVVVGRRECDAWVAYYRHEWSALLIASVGLVRDAFGMNAARTLAGAWFVLRANQAWAPYPDNDPERARSLMRRFYSLVAADGRLRVDPAQAAEREVDWWRIHRVHQRESGVTENDLTCSVSELYSYVYGVPTDSVEGAARLRVLAMRMSDQWVADGCDVASAALAEQRRTLVASYTSLRDAIDRRDT